MVSGGRMTSVVNRFSRRGFWWRVLVVICLMSWTVGCSRGANFLFSSAHSDDDAEAPRDKRRPDSERPGSNPETIEGYLIDSNQVEITEKSEASPKTNLSIAGKTGAVTTSNGKPSDYVVGVWQTSAIGKMRVFHAE